MLARRWAAAVATLRRTGALSLAFARWGRGDRLAGEAADAGHVLRAARFAFAARGRSPGLRSLPGWIIVSET